MQTYCAAQWDSHNKQDTRNHPETDQNSPLSSPLSGAEAIVTRGRLNGLLQMIEPIFPPPLELDFKVRFRRQKSNIYKHITRRIDESNWCGQGGEQRKSTSSASVRKGGRDESCCHKRAVRWDACRVMAVWWLTRDYLRGRVEVAGGAKHLWPGTSRWRRRSPSGPRSSGSPSSFCARCWNSGPELKQTNTRINRMLWDWIRRSRTDEVEEEEEDEDDGLLLRKLLGLQVQQIVGIEIGKEWLFALALRVAISVGSRWRKMHQSGRFDKENLQRQSTRVDWDEFGHQRNPLWTGDLSPSDFILQVFFFASFFLVIFLSFLFFSFLFFFFFANKRASFSDNGLKKRADSGDQRKLMNE